MFAPGAVQGAPMFSPQPPQAAPMAPQQVPQPAYAAPQAPQVSQQQEAPVVAPMGCGCGRMKVAGNVVVFFLFLLRFCRLFLVRSSRFRRLLKFCSVRSRCSCTVAVRSAGCSGVRFIGCVSFGVDRSGVGCIDRFEFYRCLFGCNGCHG